MKLSELMKGYTPDAEYTGWVTNDDMVLAIGINNTADTSDYEVMDMGVAGLDSNMNPVTVEKTYIRAGKSTQKTGTQRSFKVTGDRYVGDPAQDYCLSHAIKYGRGQKCIVPYVYFDVLTGKGEKGEVSIIVNSDGSGNAGESAGIDIEFKKVGAEPSEFTYTTSA